jgi:hypothetical protein
VRGQRGLRPRVHRRSLRSALRRRRPVRRNGRLCFGPDVQRQYLQEERWRCMQQQRRVRERVHQRALHAALRPRRSVRRTCRLHFGRPVVLPLGNRRQDMPGDVANLPILTGVVKLHVKNEPHPPGTDPCFTDRFPSTDLPHGELQRIDLVLQRGPFSVRSALRVGSIRSRTRSRAGPRHTGVVATLASSTGTEARRNPVRDQRGRHSRPDRSGGAGG